MKQQNNQLQKKHSYVFISAVLFLIIFAFGSLAFILSMWQIRHTDAGQELSQAVEIRKLHLQAAVNGEITLVLKMASSPLIQRYFLNPEDPDLERIALEELAGYRKVFSSNSIFWVNNIDRKFYFDEIYEYTVDPNNPDNYWYNMTITQTKPFNFNINFNPDLGVTDFWINAPVLDADGRPIGIVGTGIDVSAFVDSVYASFTGDASLFFINEAGEITGARDKHLVANKTSLESELGKNGSLVLSMLRNLNGEETQYFNIPEGIVALGSVPEFNWYVCAILPIGLKYMLGTSMTVLFLVMIALIAVIFVAFNVIYISSGKIRERNFLKDMSTIDVLTETYTRSFLEENLEHLIKSMSRSKVSLGVLMLKVDFFREYTQKYGHSMGDICLKTIANILTQNIFRTDDFAARYGEEEFVIVLPNVDENGMKLVAERILNSVCKRSIPHEKSDVAKFVTISIGGTAGIVNHPHTKDDYLEKASHALEISRQNGCNRFTTIPVM